MISAEAMNSVFEEKGSSRFLVGDFVRLSYFRKLEAMEFEVFLITQAVGAALDDADFVAEASTKPRATLFSGLQ